jgi:hypothetical protein
MSTFRFPSYAFVLAINFSLVPETAAAMSTVLKPTVYMGVTITLPPPI